MKQRRGRAVLLCSTRPPGKTRACSRISLLPSSVGLLLALAQPSQKRSMGSHSSNKLPSSAELCSRCGAGWRPAGPCSPAPGGRRNQTLAWQLQCPWRRVRSCSWQDTTICLLNCWSRAQPQMAPGRRMTSTSKLNFKNCGLGFLPACDATWQLPRCKLKPRECSHIIPRAKLRPLRKTQVWRSNQSETSLKRVCDESVENSSLPGPPGRPHSEYQPPLKLWAGVDQEETRKQRQREFLRCRRLFMAVERERVRERQRQRERQHRVAQIKRQKENQRWAEEQRMRDMAEQREPSRGEGAWEALAQLQLEERRVRDRQQRDKEHMRYVEALRAQMREKVKFCNIDLPPLCSCGSDFWDSHPDTCANNCVFYKNHKAYSQALHSVISSYAHAATRPLQDLAALCARAGKRL
ncbi:coiled-coil domain-containing protein 15 isoform X2 [Chamaea fasciata]|uniref:coiled-coil domain-containing protein 15 isoform X2 n=1 Tax=Chamaea fasciata TaxID=190680 RepID=UPI00336AD5E0